jgi:hypothetical protein
VSPLTYARLVIACLTCVGVASNAHAQTPGQAPLGRVTIHVDAGVRTKFFDRLRGFAEHEAFAIRIAPTHPDGAHFLAQLWREDVKVVGTNSMDANTFDVFFFANGAHDLPPGVVTSMMDDLKRIVDIPTTSGIKVIDEPEK